jgi:hypothetical protein
MPKFSLGDQVLYHFRRPDLIRIRFRTGSGLPLTFEVMRVLPADVTREHAYQVRSPLEPFARVVKEHELAPVA